MDATAARSETFNRAHRRRLRAFGRGRTLTTVLIPTPLPPELAGHPRERAIKNAIGEATAEAVQCFVCRQRASRAGAFLFAWSDTASGIAVAQCCPACWCDASDEAVESGAVRVLRGALPGGNFLD